MAETSQRTDLDFEEFRKLLEAERGRLLSLHHRQRSDMEEESRGVSEDELATSDYNEPGDISAALADRDRDKAMDVEVMSEVHEIDKALERIANGTYGLDIISGAPIPIARLRDLPWASMTVENADNALDYGYSTEA